jgi:hypothetical protein
MPVFHPARRNEKTQPIPALPSDETARCVRCKLNSVRAKKHLLIVVSDQSILLMSSELLLAAGTSL